MRKSWTAIRMDYSGGSHRFERLRWAQFQTLAEASAWCATMTAGDRAVGLGHRTYLPRHKRDFRRLRYA